MWIPRATRSIDHITAIAVAAAIGMNINLGFGVSVGAALATAAAVLWLRTALSSRRYAWLLILAAAAVASGVVLTLTADVGIRTSLADMFARSALVVSLLTTTGALVWAAALLTPKNMALAFGTGMMLGVPFNVSSDPNAWRFTYSLAVSVFVLALVMRERRLLPQLIALGALAAIGFFNDARSNSSMLLLAGALILVQHFASRGPVRRSPLGLLTIVVVTGFALYSLVVSMILDGAFGEITQQRTQAQIDRGGTLVLGGRPEVAASTALIMRHPLGMGSGVGVSYDDMVAAKSGMRAIGYDPNNGYVERYMFGGSIEVHSTLGNLWLWFGIAGALLVCLLLWNVVSGLLVDIMKGTGTALFAFLAIRFVWDTAFSPASSALRLLPLTLALALVAYFTTRNGTVRTR